MTPDPAKRPSTTPGQADLQHEWERSGQPIEAVVSSLDGSSTPLLVHFRDLGPAHRTRRAARSLAVCWALAAVSILLPLAHFLLVPAFLLAGPFLAWRRYEQQRLILGANVPCPRCGANNMLEPGPEDWPAALICEGCRSSLSVELA